MTTDNCGDNQRPAATFPTADQVAAIADLHDPVIRNLRITWSYFQLNRAMGQIIEGRDLCWCGFAIWASKTAGSFIRLEEFPDQMEKWVQRSLRRAGPLVGLLARVLRIHKGHATSPATAPGSEFTLWGFAHEVLTGVSGSIAGGNQDVFRNIAPPFANLLVLWTAKQGDLSEADRGQFLASLRDSRDPGQGDYLARAFAATFEAAAATSPRARAQAMLHANALIGYVEQSRVQPYIEKSMNCPVADLFMTRLHTHLHGRFPHWLAELLHALLRPLGPALEAEFRRLSTEWMMKLQLPGEPLWLGKDVPPLPDGGLYPKDLDTLDMPQPLKLFEQLHATEAAGSAAQDWAKFEQRMRYIGVLFRSRQAEKTLFAQPFTDAQVAQLQEERVPSGSL
jgi:hypothetical protein